MDIDLARLRGGALTMVLMGAAVCAHAGQPTTTAVRLAAIGVPAAPLTVAPGPARRSGTPRPTSVAVVPLMHTVSHAVSPVSEPPPYVMLLLGIVGIAALRLRRPKR